LLQALRRPSADRDVLLGDWGAPIRPALQALDIERENPILVGCSATSESLDNRVRYRSQPGTVAELEAALERCLIALAGDVDLRNAKVHLIIQKKVLPDSGKGHLSNERHCYEEARDWLGQFEGPNLSEKETFTVNLRNWRTKPKAS